MADIALTQEVMEHLHNWFPHTFATGFFSFHGGESDQLGFLQDGQYFRVVGSVFNDGLHLYPDAELHDEDFEGEVWGLAVPPAFEALVDDIFDYATANPVSSTLTSESFGGYSYTKGTDPSTGAAVGWQGAFKSRLNPYRRLP